MAGSPVLVAFQRRSHFPLGMQRAIPVTAVLQWPLRLGPVTGCEASPKYKQNHVLILNIKFNKTEINFKPKEMRRKD